jgi:hypothetical protein
MDGVVVVTVESIDPDTWQTTSAFDYVVPARRPGLFFSRPGKVKIGLKGWVRISDNFSQEAVFEACPGIKYKTVFDGDPVYKPAESLDSWFKTSGGASPDRL